MPPQYQALSTPQMVPLDPGVLQPPCVDKARSPAGLQEACGPLSTVYASVKITAISRLVKQTPRLVEPPLSSSRTQSNPQTLSLALNSRIVELPTDKKAKIRSCLSATILPGKGCRTVSNPEDNARAVQPQTSALAQQDL